MPRHRAQRARFSLRPTAILRRRNAFALPRSTSKQSLVAFFAVLAVLLGTSVPAAIVHRPSSPVAFAKSGTSSSQQVTSAIAAPVNRGDFGVLDAAESLLIDSAAVSDVGFRNDPDADVQWPFLVGVRLGDGFGSRVPPCSGCSAFHSGLDLQPGAGAPIQAVADGIVREAGISTAGLGVWAEIDHVIDGQKVTSVYAHMQSGSLQLVPGQKVKVGQRVGKVGNTGQTTGPHLHLEILKNGIEPIDPYSWLARQQILSKASRR